MRDALAGVVYALVLVAVVVVAWKAIQAAVLLFWGPQTPPPRTGTPPRYVPSRRCRRRLIRPRTPPGRRVSE